MSAKALRYWLVLIYDIRQYVQYMMYIRPQSDGSRRSGRIKFILSLTSRSPPRVKEFATFHHSHSPFPGSCWTSTTYLDTAFVHSFSSRQIDQFR